MTTPGNFAALIDAAVRRAPEQIAVIDGDISLTYGELARLAAGIAPWLAERGVRRGDRVALVLPNSAAFVIALYGALRAGATVAPLNPQLTAAERTQILADFAPALVIDAPIRTRGELTPATDDATPALVLYTSGSTGRPKGAVLSQRALIAANRAWAGPMLALSPSVTSTGPVSQPQFRLPA